MKTPLQRVSAAFCASALLSAAVFADEPLIHPVTRITMSEGYAITVVQAAVTQRDDCVKANQRFNDVVMSGCATCIVEESRCPTALAGNELDAAYGRPLPEYSVVAGALRIIVTGRMDTVRAACEQIAANSQQQGVSNAACLLPNMRP